ncbi:MAG: peptide deformylase [Candidatus Pacebacteria bacterium]|nr:peptide deformylase [Candidatus Paceibacterota bacterium]
MEETGNEKIKIYQKGEKVLREKAKNVPVSEIKSKKIKAILKKMAEAVAENEEAVAVAAPQIGESRRIFLISKWALNSEKEKKEFEGQNIVFINPKIIKESQKKKSVPESCLSAPNLMGVVDRAEKIKVEAYDENGEKFERGASGFFAQAIQHEIDHLDGVLFIDKAENLQKYKK